MFSDRYNRFLASFEEVAPLFRMSTAETLYDSYQEPGRSYHTLDHILMLLRLFDKLRDLTAEPLAVKAAIYFHDAVYHIPQDAEYPRPLDNEERSVRMMWNHARSADSPILKKAEACIMATANHTTSADRDVCFLHDVDLSIMASSRQRFIRAERQIYAEYNVYPQPLYTAARTGILRSFLEQRQIYALPELEKLWGQRARDNLGWAISELGQGRIPGQ